MMSAIVSPKFFVSDLHGNPKDHERQRERAVSLPGQ